MIDYLVYFIAILLVTSASLLTILIPGGPVENRNFSHINPSILIAFNTFLTLLGLGSFVLAIFICYKFNWAFYMASLCAVGYFLVYILDLKKIFPVSPDEMPRALFIIEVIGLIISIPLFALSVVAIYSLQVMDNYFTVNSYIVTVSAIMILLALGIIIFATKSAMKK